jgi:hypothetical protein
MSTLRRQLAGLALLLTLAFVLALGWLSWTDHVAAQQVGEKQKADAKTVERAGPSVDAQDVAVMKALNSEMKVKFNNRPMKDVLDFIDETAKGALNIVIDEQAFNEVGPDLLARFLNDPVNLEFKQPRKIRCVLNLLLGPRMSGYYIEDGSVFITTYKKALAKLIVKSYPVSNLVGGQKLISAAIQELQLEKSGPLGKLLGQNLDALTEEIMGAVEPEHWKMPAQPDAPGTMQFVPATASLQVRARLEVHYLLMASGLLDNSRKMDAVPFDEPDPKGVKVRAYDIAGLIDPKKYESSKAELLSALNLAITKEAELQSTPSMVILGHAKLLVARQTLENHRRISELLWQMKGARSGQPGTGTMHGVFGSYGGALFDGQSGGVFGNPGGNRIAPPPAGGGFLGDAGK